MIGAGLWWGLQLAALGLVIVAFGSLVRWTWQLGISPIPSSPGVHRAIERWLKQHPPGPGLVIEPGAGWGGLAVRLARLLPEHQIIAYERSLLPWLWLKLRLRLGDYPNLHVHREDFHEAPWADASLVVCYLFTGGMRRLREPLAQRLPPEAWIISNTFSLPGWTPQATLRLDDLYRTPIYVYKTPESTPHHGEQDAPPTDTRADR